MTVHITTRLQTVNAPLSLNLAARAKPFPCTVEYMLLCVYSYSVGYTERIGPFKRLHVSSLAWFNECGTAVHIITDQVSMNTPIVGCVKAHKMSKVTILQNVDLHPNSHSITGHRFSVTSKHSTSLANT